MRRDLAEAAERMAPRGYDTAGPRRKRLLKLVDETAHLLEPGELILEVATGTHVGATRSTSSAILVTDRRALIGRRWGVTGRANESLTYSRMSGVSTARALGAASLAVLKQEAPAQAEDLMADRLEPDLPEPKNQDSFLKGLQPIQMLG